MADYSGSHFSFRSVLPAPELQAEIDFYYQGESQPVGNGESDLSVHALFLPIGAIEMVVNYHGTSVRLTNDRRKSCFSRGVIIGPHSLQTVCIADNFGEVNKSFHIRFKPGGFCGLFGLNQSEFKNNLCTVDEVLGREGKELEERLDNSVSWDERVRIVDSFLIRKKSDSRRLGRIAISPAAIALIEKHNSKTRVRQLARELCLSDRALEWEFSRWIGLAPKEYIRVSRFRRVLNEMLSTARSLQSGDLPTAPRTEDQALPGAFDWTRAAEAGGYYDQAHLINEFKEATNLTPGVFLKEVGRTFFKSINLLVFLKPHPEPRSALPVDYLPFIEDFLEIEKASSKPLL
ncbi:MAG: DUF6597 domain-containing transcriptional factor [Acidobacteriota bacterium]